jgi:hypothetical protein
MLLGSNPSMINVVLSSTHFRIFEQLVQRQSVCGPGGLRNSETFTVHNLDTYLVMNCFIYLVMDPLSHSLDHPDNNSSNLTNLNYKKGE